MTRVQRIGLAVYLIAWLAALVAERWIRRAPTGAMVVAHVVLLLAAGAGFVVNTRGQLFGRTRMTGWIIPSELSLLWVSLLAFSFARDDDPMGWIGAVAFVGCPVSLVVTWLLERRASAEPAARDDAHATS